ncbi:hypothetical protein [Candidatus Laterigemmans baculatus]|uniref:hypothetical protein n=1 Tax=Candidatus Laterigemmans baculatus TaxID=2770505 RepID=UPI0013DCDC30|nr:hypothetical protein [Candidatus Laterigemmans baculatus]
MPATLTGLLETAFTGPVWPASVMLGFLLIYAILILVGLADADLESPEFGSGGDLPEAGGELPSGGAAGSGAAGSGSLGGGGAEELPDSLDSLGSLGAATVRWLNLSRVPLFVWMGLFGFTWWVISLVLWDAFDRHRYAPTLLASLLLASRNAVLAVGVTKLATGPMTRWFERNHFYRSDRMIGEECEISTTEATAQFGRAKYKTDAAPLLLNVRTTGETLVKGQRATIVDFDTKTRIYTVQSSEADR